MRGSSAGRCRSGIFAGLSSSTARRLDARDWLQSDWEPVGTSLPGDAGPRRIDAVGEIGAAKNAIDQAKNQIHRALEHLDRAAEQDPR
ncbi:hypothetical protein [Nocardia asiatica]|uniref:hypothetical protein n=1 Tax=Nocardia asiatica TaxID=209252 RepID=UPI002455122D|nr:hypothetical protein [Nocardia asiatica]